MSARSLPNLLSALILLAGCVVCSMSATANGVAPSMNAPGIKPGQAQPSVRATENHSDREAAKSIVAAGAQLDQKRISSMFERPRSFCFSVFSKDVGSSIRALLEAKRYAVRRVSVESGGLFDVHSVIGVFNSATRNIVRKAYRVIDGRTILLDPEMVLSTDDKALATFCAAHSATVYSALWERVSESALFMEVDGKGLTRRTVFTQGKLKDQKGELFESLGRDPSARGLAAEITRHGMPIAELFSSGNWQVFELQE